MINQLHNYHVLSDHCYYIKQHKPVKHLLKGCCPGLGKDGAVREKVIPVSFKASRFHQQILSNSQLNQFHSYFQR